MDFRLTGTIIGWYGLQVWNCLHIFCWYVDLNFRPIAVTTEFIVTAVTTKMVVSAYFSESCSLSLAPGQHQLVLKSCEMTLRYQYIAWNTLKWIRTWNLNKQKLMHLTVRLDWHAAIKENRLGHLWACAWLESSQTRVTLAKSVSMIIKIARRTTGAKGYYSLTDF